jgi:predicted 3-demethylubiquinone-9 3-methyltransferase (glyoxalase superfamily)
MSIMPNLSPIVLTVLLASFTCSLGGCAAVNSQGTRPASDSVSHPDKVTTFLMFEGDAEEAMNFYISLFDDSEIIAIERFGPEGHGPEGTVYHARFTLAGRLFMAFDSPAPHPFTFTPSISLFVTCETEEELERLYAALSEDGEVMMPLNDYGFSRRYGWVSDRFGVSWQLNLPHE